MGHVQGLFAIEGLGCRAHRTQGFGNVGVEMLFWWVGCGYDLGFKVRVKGYEYIAVGLGLYEIPLPPVIVLETGQTTSPGVEAM